MKTWQIKALRYDGVPHYEYVIADYFIITDCGAISFHIFDIYPEHVQSLYEKLKTSAENRIAAYNAAHWVSVQEYEVAT